MIDTSVLDKRFRKLFQDGKLVQLHIGKWGMSHQLSADDLGLKPEDNAVANFMALGKKWLMPVEVRQKFNKVESAARRFLEENSHDFPLASAHFVPRSKLVALVSRLEKYKEEFDQLSTDFLEGYEGHKLTMLTRYADYRDVLEPHYPPAGSLGGKFFFQVNVFEVAFPSRLKSVTVTDILAQNLAVEQAAKKYEAQMEQQYRHSVSQMESFVKESAMALRKEVVGIFDTLASKLKSGEVVSGKNFTGIKGLIDSFEALDFFDDAKVRDRLQEVKKLVNSSADFKTDSEVLARLTTAVNNTLETARNLTDIDQLTGEYLRRLDFGNEI